MGGAQHKAPHCQPIAADKVITPRHGRSGCAPHTESSCALFCAASHQQISALQALSPNCRPPSSGTSLIAPSVPAAGSLPSCFMLSSVLSSMACVDPVDLVVRDISLATNPLCNDRPAWTVRDVSRTLEPQ